MSDLLGDLIRRAVGRLDGASRDALSAAKRLFEASEIGKLLGARRGGKAAQADESRQSNSGGWSGIRNTVGQIVFNIRNFVGGRAAPNAVDQADKQEAKQPSDAWRAVKSAGKTIGGLLLRSAGEGATALGGGEMAAGGAVLAGAAGGAAQGAGAVGAVAAATGPMGASIAATVGFGAALTSAAAITYKFTSVMAEGKRELARYNTGIAEALGKLDRADILRQRQYAANTSESSVALIEAVNEMKDAVQPVAETLGNAMNTLGAWGAKAVTWITTITEYLHITAKNTTPAADKMLGPWEAMLGEMRANAIERVQQEFRRRKNGPLNR